MTGLAAATLGWMRAPASRRRRGLAFGLTHPFAFRLDDMITPTERRALCGERADLNGLLIDQQNVSRDLERASEVVIGEVPAGDPRQLVLFDGE